MISQSGTRTHAKLLDFGISTLTQNTRPIDYKSLTLTQETLGTPVYSAPEQLRGETPTTRTDLYIWGLVLIECLVGYPAISGSSLAAVFQKQLDISNIPIPSALAGHPVADLLRRVLNKKVNERASDAKVVFGELKQINFSNLVGLTGNKPKASCSTDATTTIVSQHDKTLIEARTYNVSHLAERKQLTVLALCLKTETDHPAPNFDQDLIDTLQRDFNSQCLDIAIGYGAYHVGTLANHLLFYFRLSQKF